MIWAGSSGTAPCGSGATGGVTPGDTGSLAGTGASYSASYSYDTLNWLTNAPLGSSTYGDGAHVDAATAVGSASGSAWSASYDAAGNMICRAATSATTCAGASPTGAQLGYDNEGRLTAWQNTPSSPTSTADYLYDGEGNRVAEVATSSSGATTTSFIGGLEEVTTSGSITTTTAYYGGGLAESVNGVLSYLLSDPTLGSASVSVNLSGLVTASQLYSPYGSVRSSSGILPTDYGFTHQRADATTGLDDDGARWYDPVAGQFASADTTLAGGLNRYAYVAGNPETLVDPTGAYAQACDSSQCGSELPVGATGASSGGPGGGTTTADPPVESDPVETSSGSGGRLSTGGAIALIVVFGGIALGIAANLGAEASQGIWHAWSVWQAEHPAPGSVGRTDTTSGSGPSYTRSQTNALDAAQAAGGGNGGSGGSGTVPRTPPPTQNGEAIGFGAPILAEDALAECDPLLPTAQYCIGYTRYSNAPGNYLAKAAPVYGPLNGIVDGVYVNHRGIAEPWRAWYDPTGRIIARTDYTAGNLAAGIPPVHYHLFYWNPGATPGEVRHHFPGEFEPDEWPMWPLWSDPDA